MNSHEGENVWRNRFESPKSLQCMLKSQLMQCLLSTRRLVLDKNS